MLLTEQPIDEVFGFDPVIGGIEPRLKRQHDFFVVVADTLQRCKLPLAHILTHHGLRYLDILFLVGSRCDEIHLRIANLANRYIIAPAKQFKVNNILDGVTAVPITKAQQIIAKADVNDIVFSECTEVCLALPLMSNRLIS